jgi:hypothetical protein
MAFRYAPLSRNLNRRRQAGAGAEDRVIARWNADLALKRLHILVDGALQDLRQGLSS